LTPTTRQAARACTLSDSKTKEAVPSFDRATIAQKGGDNLTTEVKIEKGISDLVSALTDPIIVFPGGWGSMLPEWLKNAITLERLVMNMKALKGEEPTGTDAEACAYLYTACLTQPIDSDWTQIYLYVANQVYSRYRTKESGVQFPEDIRVRSLSDYQIAELRRLKQWIYERRTQAKQERERAERQKKREEEATKRSMERPVLFEF
jgi:hypothetical protein